MTPVVMTLDSVSFHYGRHRAVDDVSGHFHAGSLTAVAGPNGAGKSTLLKLMAGILKPQKGFVGTDPLLRERIGYLPQTSALAKDYPLLVWQAVATGLWSQVGWGGAIGVSERAKVEAALEDVELSSCAQRRIEELSGGQFQRMLFARLIVQDPQILLLDEPFAAVDGETTAKLMGLLLRWHQQGRTIVCVLHDLMLIRKYFPESFVLSGKCLGRGHTHALFEQKLLSFDLDMAELYSSDAQGGHGA